MSANKNDNKQYTAADIQRYLKGQMSAEEMHAIETAALDDPFLADAIEGFQGATVAGKESISTGLARLNKEFSERIKQQGKVASMTQSRWWQIGAAAIILLSTGIALYNNRNSAEPDSDTLAVNSKQQDDRSVKEKVISDSQSLSARLADT